MIRRFKMSLNVSSSTKPENKNWGPTIPDLNSPHQFPGKEKGQDHLVNKWCRKMKMATKSQPPQSQESCAQCAVSTVVVLRSHVGSTLPLTLWFGTPGTPARKHGGQEAPPPGAPVQDAPPHPPLGCISLQGAASRSPGKQVI